MIKRAFLGALILICFAILVGCGERTGINPLGVTGGGGNGYGSAGGSDGGSVSVSDRLIGTWRDNLDSRYYTQFRFSENGACEILHVGIDDSFHYFGHYTIRYYNPGMSLSIFVNGDDIFFAHFHFEGDVLVFEGEGGNFIYHRVG